MEQDQKPRWHFKTSTLIVGFLLVGPFILPLVWSNPAYSRAKKALLSVVIIVVSAALLMAVKASFKSISEYYQVIQGGAY